MTFCDEVLPEQAIYIYVQYPRLYPRQNPLGCNSPKSVVEKGDEQRVLEEPTTRLAFAFVYMQTIQLKKKSAQGKLFQIIQDQADYTKDQANLENLKYTIGQL